MILSSPSRRSYLIIVSVKLWGAAEDFFIISKFHVGAPRAVRQMELPGRIDCDVPAENLIESFVRDYISERTNRTLPTVCAFNIKENVFQLNLHIISI